MSNKTKKNVKPVKKPFLQGAVTDEQTWKSAAGFLGLMAVAGIMSFLVCSMTGFDQPILRYVLNLGIEIVLLSIFYNRGVSKGTDAVSRGEILWQRGEKGLPVADSERDLCYHPLKGYLTGLMGALPLVLIALIFAFLAQVQETGVGVLPSWMQVYLRRSEIGNPLTLYTQPEGLGVVDIMRILIRIMIMPVVSMVGVGQQQAVLWVERLSPLILLLPACVYGFGYTRGPAARTIVHTEIAENTKRRARRERKARKARMARGVPKEPQQLN